MRMKHDSGTALCADGDWVAVQVRMKRERFVAEQLANHGYEPFLPTAAVAPTGRRRAAEQALFPGYVFCRYKTQYDFRIVQAYGVIRIVGVHGTPVAIPDDEVEAIRRVIDAGLYAEPWRFIRQGERVLVCAGPLAGFEGILVRVKNGIRVLVSVTLLERSVAVELGVNDIRPVSYSGLWPEPEEDLMPGAPFVHSPGR